MFYKGRHRPPNNNKKIAQGILIFLTLATLFFIPYSAQGANSPPVEVVAIEVVPEMEIAPRAPFTPPASPTIPPPSLIEIELEPEPVAPGVEPEDESNLEPTDESGDLPAPQGGPCPTRGFGGVHHHVAAAGYHLIGLFGIHESSVGGVANRPKNPTSDHPRGLALDFTVNNATGDALAKYAEKNMEALGITYVLWQVPDHYDHVHISFAAREGTGVLC